MTGALATIQAGEIANIKPVRKRIASLKPSPENVNLYRPQQHDPDLVSLATSIAARGLHEPLVVTLDNYIVSGHRRHAALVMNGQVLAPCRVLPVRRDEMSADDYVALLREFNRTRHKSVAEQVREELVDTDPTAARRRLREHRSRSVYAAELNGVEALVIEGVKHRSAVSDQKADHVKYVKQVVFADRKAYWPLSVRGVHYALLNYDFLRNIPRRIPYKNDDPSYSATSDLITRLRLDGVLPWEAFDDGTRPLKEYHAFSDAREFVRQEVNNLFGGYWRNLLQSQPNHIEIVCEKNTVYHMVLRVADEYQIPTMSARGFNSIDPWHDLYVRYKTSGKQRLIVIVLSDYDPEGELIPIVGGRTLRDDFGVQELSIIKAGVTRRQIDTYNLPPMNFAKESSGNFGWFVGRTGGNLVYELEALDPEVLLAELDGVIRSVIDVDLLNREVAAEEEDAAYLEAAKKTAGQALKGIDL